MNKGCGDDDACPELLENEEDEAQFVGKSFL